MQVTDDMLSAYLDGEIGRDDARAIEAELERSEPLRLRLQSLDRASRLSRQAFDDVMREPVPAHLVEAVLGRTASAPPRRLVPRATWTMALAASLALAVGIAVALTMVAPSGPADSSGLGAVGLAVRGSLAHALDQLASGESLAVGAGPGGTNETITAVVTFPRRGGGWCREYRVASGATGAAGVACRTDATGWRIAVHHPWQPPEPVQGKPVSPAATPSPPAVDAIAESLMGGNRVVGPAESDLIAGGWRNP